MKKAIFSIILISFLVINSSLILAEKPTQYECVNDSDCKVKFSSCSCSNVCVLKSTETNIDCARACTIEESNTTIKKCECRNNKCTGSKENNLNSVCGNGVCEENEVGYPTGAPHLNYCLQDCNNTSPRKWDLRRR